MLLLYSLNHSGAFTEVTSSSFTVAVVRSNNVNGVDGATGSTFCAP
jgi:hypothetical protein